LWTVCEEKRNPSGVVSVQVIDKSGGRYKVLKTIGSSSIPKEGERLYREAMIWIRGHGGELEIEALLERDEKAVREEEEVEQFLSKIDKILIKGTELILNRVFHLTGFDRIEDKSLRHLVLARLCQPSSKAAQSII
jgi:hypothetical protein